MMRIRRWSPLVALDLVTLLVAGCGNATPSGTAVGTATVAPTVVTTPAPPQTLAPTALIDGGG